MCINKCLENNEDLARYLVYESLQQQKKLEHTEQQLSLAKIVNDSLKKIRRRNYE